MSVYDFMGPPEPEDPEAALHAHLDSNPEVEAALQQIYGIDPNAAPEAAQTFEPTGVQSFLEQLSGLQNVQGPRPRNFWEGLATGAVQGLGAAGGRVSKARATFEAQQAEHRKAADAQHLAASLAYRNKLADQVTAGAASGRTATTKQAEYERDNPAVTAEMQAANPELRRIPIGTRVPASLAYAKMEKADKTLAEIEAESRARAKGGVEGGGTSLTPEQALLWAAFTRTTGIPPPLGRGGIGSPAGQAITNAMLGPGGQPAGAPAPNPSDVGANLGGAKATYGATAGSLKDIEKSLSQQTVFANKLKLNTDRLRGTMGKIANLGPRFLNGPVRNALGQLGSTDQAAFRAALLPVRNESARLLFAGPALGGQLTVEAQKDLRAIAGEDFSVDQLNAVLDILENDAKNGIDMYTKQRDVLRNEVRGGGGPTTPAGSTQSRTRPSLQSFDHP